MARGRRGGDYGYGISYGGFATYVPVAERRYNAEREAAKLGRNGKELSPVALDGHTIARSFWGKAWCANLESYSDYSNRLPRGRTYVRSGAVVDLQIASGKVTAKVSGSSLYSIEITIAAVAKERWRQVLGSCAGKIDSLVELLQGRLSQSVMATVTGKESGLFPSPKEITLSCSCPDWATMCKHVAATLYGVGNRLDEKPELLFLLRKVDHLELVTQAAAPAAGLGGRGRGNPSGAARLGSEDLGAMFGIEIDGAVAQRPGGKTKAMAVAKPKARAKAKAPEGERGFKDSIAGRALKAATAGLERAAKAATRKKKVGARAGSRPRAR